MPTMELLTQHTTQQMRGMLMTPPFKSTLLEYRGGDRDTLLSTKNPITQELPPRWAEL